MTSGFPPPKLRQTAANVSAKGNARSIKATFSEPTREYNLLVLTVVLVGGDGETFIRVPAGFQLIRKRTQGLMELAMYYWQGAPSISEVTVSVGFDRSMQVRVKEYSGAHQTNALDRVAVLSSRSSRCDTSWSGLTAQPDQVVIASIANRNALTRQSGFIGGLIRLFETVTPQYYGQFGYNADGDRSRLTVHELIATAIASFRLLAYLSTQCDWVAMLVTFRGGSSGPKRMTSNPGPSAPMLTTAGGGGTATLSAFGKFTSTEQAAMLSTRGGSATILPFAYQFRANGLLLGQDTRYDVVSHDGLYGYDMRTSDEEQSRGDGAQRGIDLQAARQIVMKIEVGGAEGEVEQLVAVLFRALRPQMDLDWELVWRHPGVGARMLRCRPVQLPRETTHDRSYLAPLNLALRAADPRHYSATPKRVVVPVSPASGAPVMVTARNEGDISAYPLIRINGPTSGPPVQRVELVNSNGLVTFEAQLTLPPGSVLVADMEARVTGAPRSTITLDGQSKYGAWELPRTPFELKPDPIVGQGNNSLYLRTEPAGAPVSCTLDYRDTWAG